MKICRVVVGCILLMLTSGGVVALQHETKEHVHVQSSVVKPVGRRCP